MKKEYKPLKNMIFCSSGFDGTEEYDKIIKKIEELGGTFYDVLKGATNYLISYKSCSQKAIVRSELIYKNLGGF